MMEVRTRVPKVVSIGAASSATTGRSGSSALLNIETLTPALSHCVVEGVDEEGWPRIGRWLGLPRFRKVEKRAGSVTVARRACISIGEGRNWAGPTDLGFSIGPFAQGFNWDCVEEDHRTEAKGRWSGRAVVNFRQPAEARGRKIKANQG